MILWPVIERELRSASRQRRTYWTRLAAAFAGFAICAWAVWEGRLSPDQSRLGYDTFSAVSFIALVMTLLAGVTQTADAISEERREGTLGLLFLTDLRGAHVVLGKLAANSISAFLSLASILPILAIAFLLGGVSPVELGKVALQLSAALFASLCAGLCASTLAKDDRITRTLAFAIVILIFVIPWKGAPALNIFAAWQNSADLRSPIEKEIFWTHCKILGVATFAFLAAAARRAERLWREQPTAPRLEKIAANVRSHFPARAARRARALDRNPMEWLAMRRNVIGSITLALVAIGAFIAASNAFMRYKPVEEDLAIILTITLHWIVKFAAALVAGGLLAKASKEGALELILTTPLDPRLGIEGQLIGFLRIFAPAIAIVIVMDILFIRYVSFNISVSASAFKTFLTLRIAVFVLDLAAIAFYGLWSGLRTGRAGRAAFSAFGWAVIAPIVFSIICLIAKFGDSMAAIVTVWMIWDVILIARTLPDLFNLRGRVSEGFRSNSARA